MNILNLTDETDKRGRRVWVIVLTLIVIVFTYVQTIQVKVGDQQVGIRKGSGESVHEEVKSIPLGAQDDQEAGRALQGKEGAHAHRAVPSEVEETIEQPVVPEAITAFVESYPGSRIDSGYLDLLSKECADAELLKEVVAISVAEGAMGRDLPYRHSNFWGWFAGGNRNYDPTREVMASVICTGIGNNYRGIGTNPTMIARYTGNDRPGNWSKIFNWAYAQM